MSNTGSDTESSSLGSSQRRKGVIDTRRAEQNRAAQRAFRQRKERYVKELENKVRDMQGLQERMEKLEEENEELRQRLWELVHRPSAAATPSSSWTPSSTAATDLATISMDEPSQQLSPPSSSRPAANPPSTITNKTAAVSAPPPAPPRHHHHHHHRYHPYSPPPTLPPPVTPSSRSTSNGPPLRLSDQRSQTKLPHMSIGDEPQTPVSDKGRVLDDLITILRSRNRPPIPSQLDEPAGPASRSSPGPPPPLESKQIGTTIH